jgi:hypothetical protein
MKVSITQTAPDEYVLSLDETQITATNDDLRELLKVVSGVPIPTPPKPVIDPARRFVDQIKAADDTAVQMLIRTADDDDLLVILKHAENDEPLSNKIYGNMSERSRKIFAEDLTYKFKEQVTATQVSAAVDRLIITIRDLEDKGTVF